MGTVVVDGVALAFDDVGSGDPPMVWIHGGNVHRAYWHWHQIPFFSAAHRCVAIDLRGHGESGKPEGRCSIGRFAADVAGVVTSIGLDRAVVVGHSFGCAVAVQLAVDHPDLVRALVLNDGPTMEAPAMERYQPMIDALSAGTPVAEVMDMMFTSSGFFLTRHDPAIRADIMALCTSPNHSAVETIRALAEWDRSAVHHRVTVPTLHLPGARSVCPEEQMIDAIPHVVLARTVGGGHCNAVEVPTQVNSMIAEFIRHYVD